MSDVMQGIEENVPFDHGVCNGLETACRAAASAIEGQTASRTSYVTTAMQEFRGYFSELFAANADVAEADATELAARLREVATAAADLQAAAEAEQQRRETARQWKQEQDDRNAVSRFIDDHITGEEDPPVGPADPPPQLRVSPPVNGTRETPAPGAGGGGGGSTTSARPADLQSFATGSSSLNSTLSWRPGALKGRLDDFTAQCRWGTLDASGVMSGFDAWLDANDNDVQWATTVANAFAAAGGEGEVSTLADSAIGAALQAAGVDATRDDIVIDPAIAVGNPPTTGYANDPVNTSTGNFVENEVDLAFTGATRGLLLQRSYSSFETGVGAFGRGWSSWTEVRLELADDHARLVREDGRVVVFPRLGEGWDRATGENAWLDRSGDGLRVSTNDGHAWDFTASGRLVAIAHGPGTRVEASYDDLGRLVAMTHERGRSFTLHWEGDRVVEALASDGRRLVYGYDGAGRLTSARGPLGTREYRWTDAADGPGLVDRVVDADGVVEAENTYDEQGRVVTQRSQFGRLTRFAYLAGRVTVVSDADGSRSNTYVADARGRLIGVVDAADRRQSTSYDPHGNVVSVTERDGNVTVNRHDDRGRRVRTVMPSGADIRTTYDELDRVVEVQVDDAVTRLAYTEDQRDPTLVVDPEGGESRLEWRDGLLRAATDPTGVRVEMDYDDLGDLVRTTDAAGGTVTIEHDEQGRTTSVTSATGAVTRFGWLAGLLAERCDPDGGTWRYERSTAGRLVAVVDPTGRRTEVERGTHGEVELVRDALGHETTRTWDELGNVTSLGLPDGSSWRYLHDGLSRLTAAIDPLGGAWATEYDAVGVPSRTTDPTGVEQRTTTDLARGTVRLSDGLVDTTLRLDRVGRLVATELVDGSRVLNRYDRCGRLVEQVDAAGGTTRWERDAAGRAVRVVHPSGRTEDHEHDVRGWPSARIDGAGGRTTYERDAEGRVVREVLPDGEVVETEHDPCGRVLRRRVPGWGTLRLERDLAGRVLASHDPQHGRRRYRYDDAGRLVAAVDGNGAETAYELDAAGRVVAVVDPLGARTTWEYDAAGRCVAQVDPLGRARRAGYDATGRPLWQEEAVGSRVEWVWDDTGRMQALRVDGAELHRVERDVVRRRMVVHEGGRRHELAWDPRGLLVERLRDGRGLSWEHDADGACRVMVGPDGSRTSWEHDAAGRVVAVEHPLLGRAELERDAAGRVVSAVAGGRHQRWTRADGHLVEHEVDGVVTTVSRAADGRVTAIEGDGARVSFVHDDAHQLVERRWDGLAGDSVVRWRYDAAGRLVSEDVDGVVTEHAHDAAGQLLRSRTGDAEERHEYDASGRRVRTVRPDGSERVLEWSPLGALAAVVDETTPGEQRRTTLRVDALGELAAVDDVELFWDSSTAVAPLVRVGETPVLPLGVVTGVGDDWWPVRGLAQRDATDPWAAGVPQPGPVTTTAHGELVVAGLEWLRARAYDAETRSFLSVDPLPPVVGAAWSGNPYAYAGNDPLHALDPSGLRPVTEAELEAYRQANNSWLQDNWEYVAAAGMVVAGVGLMFVPGGQAFGVGLISAGIDTGLQKYQNGSVNWGQVAVTGLIGAATGGAAGAAMRATAASGLRTTVLVNGGVGSVTNTASYAYNERGNLTVRGLFGAATGGFIGGAAGGVAGPVSGTLTAGISDAARQRAAAAGTSMLFNGSGATAGYVADDVMAGRDVDLANAAGRGYLTGLFSQASIPTARQGTLEGLDRYGAQTVADSVQINRENAEMWGNAVISSGQGLLIDSATSD